MRMRVLIADDHPLVRDALSAAVLSKWPDSQIDEAQGVAEAAEAVRANKSYALIILDLMVPDAKGFSGLLMLQKLDPDAKIVILSARDDPQAISTAYILEASAYLLKSTAMSKIADQLGRVLNNERIFPATTAPLQTSASSVRRRFDSLSAAQMRILLALADGRLNKQIAADMNLTEATVKAHLTAIFKKLGVANRTQAVLAARPLLGEP